jgi:hypothetical protein
MSLLVRSHAFCWLLTVAGRSLNKRTESYALASCSSKRESVSLAQMVFSTLVAAFEQSRLAPMATLGATMMIATTRALATPITILPCLPVFS